MVWLWHVEGCCPLGLNRFHTSHRERSDFLRKLNHLRCFWLLHRYLLYWCIFCLSVKMHNFLVLFLDPYLPQVLNQISLITDDLAIVRHDLQLLCACLLLKQNVKGWKLGLEFGDKQVVSLVGHLNTFGVQVESKFDVI